MRRIPLQFLIVSVFPAIGFFVPRSAEAVPGFARQVGVSCFSCHYQHIPKLNSFGREFKLGGMTQSAQELIEDEKFSLPPALNLGFILKYRYKSESKKGSTGTKTGTERGLWEIPGDGSIWMGGRVAENWGSVVEFGKEGIGNVKAVYSKSFGGTQGGVSVYTTDHMGAAFGMELYNTGATKGHRGWENANATSAMLAVGNIANNNLGMGGPSVGSATGFSLFAGSDLFFVNVGLWGPLTTVEGTPPQGDVAFNYGTYYRFAITPKVRGDMDMMIGLQGTAGSTKGSGGACDPKSAAYVLGSGCPSDTTWMGQPGTSPITEFATSSMALDFQLQKDIGSKTLEVVAAYVLSYEFQVKNVAGGVDTPKTDLTGFNVGATLGMTPDWGLKASYMSFKDDTNWTGAGGVNNTDSALALGVYKNIAQNVLINLEYTSWGDVDTAKGDSMENQMWVLFHVGI